MTLCRYFRLIILFTVLLLTFYIYTTSTVNLNGILDNAPGLRINISIDTTSSGKLVPQSNHQPELVDDDKPTLTPIDYRPIAVSVRVSC